MAVNCQTLLAGIAVMLKAEACPRWIGFRTVVCPTCGQKDLPGKIAASLNEHDAGLFIGFFLNPQPALLPGSLPSAAR